ncbi:MAG: tripartite tricarboxylate transporter substrate binding protein [Betaproteobacteria bacterium]|nr:MAG: tripartite tricarboxylate transporter substrate binding protein [Betaproteobacteria bacterium]
MMAATRAFGAYFSCMLAASAASSLVAASDYPSRPVRLVVASGPGGSTDNLARVLGERLAQGIKQPVVYDNRPGAGGMIAGDVAAKASPDGHTLLFSTSAAIAVSVSLYQRVPYDPVKDFAPVVLVATQPYMLIAHPASVFSVKELIAAAKANPGQISFAHTGAGTGTHLAGEFFMKSAQVKLLSVPYKSIGQSMTAVLSGETQLTFTSVFTAWTQARTGRAKALAVTGKTRSPAAPQVPTMAEAGLPNYVAGNWYGILAPAGTPGAIVQSLNRQANAILNRADVMELLIKQGFEPAGGSSEEFGRFIRAEIKEYAALIRSAGIKVQ